MNKPTGKIAAEPMTLQIRKIGNSIGIILPSDFAARHDFKEGDKLHVVEQTGNAVTLSPFDPVHAKAMQIARKIMDEYKDTFKVLAQ